MEGIKVEEVESRGSGKGQLPVLEEELRQLAHPDWPLGTEAERQLSGIVKVQKVGGRSVATRYFSKYPLRLMLPSKAAEFQWDAVWVYNVSYGGGVLAGDSISIALEVESSCTAVLTTQSSTKVYRSNDGLPAQQTLHARVGSGGLLVVVPDPVTCFKNSVYSQSQHFWLSEGGSLVLVDWLSSGRRESGEVWAFDSFSTLNQVSVEGKQPLLWDKVELQEKEGLLPLRQRVGGLHVLAVVVIVGPRTEDLRRKIEAEVERRGRERAMRRPNDFKDGIVQESQEILLASCSKLGLEGEGLLMRIGASHTEAVYVFLREQLAGLSSQLGVIPYASLGRV